MTARVIRREPLVTAHASRATAPRLAPFRPLLSRCHCLGKRGSLRISDFRISDFWIADLARRRLIRRRKFGSAARARPSSTRRLATLRAFSLDHDLIREDERVGDLRSSPMVDVSAVLGPGISSQSLHGAVSGRWRHAVGSQAPGPVGLLERRGGQPFPGPAAQLGGEAPLVEAQGEGIGGLDQGELLAVPVMVVAPVGGLTFSAWRHSQEVRRPVPMTPHPLPLTYFPLRSVRLPM